MLLVLASDLHLGRASARLPSGVSPSDHNAGQAWLRLCRLAAERGAHSVLIAGDQFDRDNRFFEAAGAWERGLQVLGSAAIPCVAVAGNHDHAAFPDWVDHRGKAFPHFHFLGANATWEVLDLPALRCIGWSFPRGSHQVHASALASFPADAVRRNLTTVAIVHTDLDASGGPYHPVRVTDLRAIPASLWVTGHLHGPRAIVEGAGTPVINPGTPQALDPGETGWHGAYLAHREGDTWRFEAAPLSTVRYETVTWTIGEPSLPDPDGDTSAAAALLAACASAEANLRPANPGDGAASLLVLRPRLNGASRWTAAKWSEWLGRLASQTGESLRVDPLAPELTPALPEDLDALAERHRGDALGVALELRKALADRHPEVEPLVIETLRTLQAAHQRFQPGPLHRENAAPDPEPTLDAARSRLCAEVDQLVICLYELRPSAGQPPDHP